MIVVIVPTEQEGLTIFPTHRARAVGRTASRAATPIAAPRRRAAGPRRSTATARYELLAAATGSTREVVERSRREGVDVHAARATRRSPRSTAARRRPRSSLRPTAIDDVWAVAGRGDVMPQKSTFFYPKLTSGLLFYAAVTRLAERLPRARSRTSSAVLEELPTRAEREPVVGTGEGGDETTAIDQAAEDAIARALPRRPTCTIVSEEVGPARRRRDDRRRDRPDRRLAEREARHPVLLPLDRGRRRPRRWATSTSATSTTSAPARSGRRRRGEGASLNGEPLGAVGRRTRSRSSRSRRRAPLSSRGDAPTARRRRAPPADHGLARALALPPRRRPRRRRLLAEAGALRRHRGGAAPLPRGRPRARALRRPAPFGAAPARPRRTFAHRRSGNADALCTQLRTRACPHRLLRLELRALARARSTRRAAAARAGSSTTRRSSTRSRSTRPSTACRPRRPSRAGSSRRRPASSSRSRRAATSRTSSGCTTSAPGSTASTSGSSRSSARPKLGPVLWQLPPTFKRDDERLAARARAAAAAARHCFEFRHPSWFAEDVYALLREHGVALVIGDQPGGRASRRTS